MKHKMSKQQFLQKRKYGNERKGGRNICRDADRSCSEAIARPYPIPRIRINFGFSDYRERSGLLGVAGRECEPSLGLRCCSVLTQKVAQNIWLKELPKPSLEFLPSSDKALRKFIHIIKLLLGVTVRAVGVFSLGTRTKTMNVGHTEAQSKFQGTRTSLAPRRFLNGTGVFDKRHQNKTVFVCSVLFKTVDDYPGAATTTTTIIMAATTTGATTTTAATTMRRSLTTITTTTTTAATSTTTTTTTSTTSTATMTTTIHVLHSIVQTEI